MTAWHEGPLAGFDLETTGVDVETARIVTATITLHFPGKPDVARSWLVNPGIDIPEDASAIHGISTEHARAAGTPADTAIREIAMGLAQIAEQGLPVVIYNAPYDLTVLDRELRRYDLAGTLPDLVVVDPFVIDKQVDQFRKGSRKLVDCAKHYGVTLDDAHTSAADAVAAVGVARAMGAKYVNVGRQAAADLHKLQVGWRSTWAVGFEKYLEKKGTPEKVPGAWPMVPLVVDVPAQEPAPAAPATKTPAKRAAKKTAAPASGSARIPKRSQGFYRDPATGEKLRSVTTILSQGVPKEALVFWAGNTVAECAMEFLPKLVRAARRPAESKEIQSWLSRAHTRKKDERADIGSAVHRIIEAHILGEPVPQELLDDPEMAPFVRHFLQFVADFEVEFTASEMVVANYDDGYAGTLDYTLRSTIIAGLLDVDPAIDFMGDTKTGGEICLADGRCVKVRPSEFKQCPGKAHSIKGVYAEAGLQMSAYRAAKIAWLRNGEKVEMPPTHDVGVVLQLRPEGYLLVFANCGEDVYAKFCHAREVAEWTTSVSKTVIGESFAAPPAQMKASA